MTNAASVPKPRLAFRVGITGTRAPDPEAMPALRRRLREVLAAMRDALDGLRQEVRAAALYTGEAPLLRLVSPLAEGSDRLAAEAALELGYRLETPLPFEAAEYELDFPETLSQFRRLLAAAEPHVLSLDGGREAAEPGSYEAVGRLVVRNCDLLIAIWNGGTSRGRGGSAEIVRYAAQNGVPVWWIPADGGDPGWIGEPALAAHPAAAPGGEAAFARLGVYLRQCMLPGPIDLPDFGFIGEWLYRLRGRPDYDPFHELFAEQHLPERPIWSAHRHLLRLVAYFPQPAPAPGAAPPPARPDPVWQYWQPFYADIDRRAIGYAERYRSSYILVFALAALAACAAILGVGFHPQALISTGFEFCFLLGILAIVAANEIRRWHPRSITDRLLAELFRKQQALGQLGWSLPTAEAVAVTGESESAPVRDVLVGWYFNAAQRAAPLPRGAFTAARLSRIRDDLAQGLVRGQKEYHAHRRDQLQRAARRFGLLGAGFFLATLVTVLLKLLVLGFVDLAPNQREAGAMNHGTIFAGLIAALLPALSAAFVGIRGYAELELLADQSLQMQRELAHRAERLERLVLDAPLASQALGAEILALAIGMLRDVRGWAQLFRVKAVDVG